MNLHTGYHLDTIVTPATLALGGTHRDIIGDVSETPPFVDYGLNLIDATGGIRNQADGEACTGFSFAETLGMELLASGYQGDAVLSARHPYWAGRAYGRKVAQQPLDTPLKDVGCAPSFIIAGCQIAGWALESECPYDTSLLEGDEETLGTSVLAAPRARIVVNAYAAIEEPASQLVAACRQALAGKTFVQVALFASPGFKAADGSQILTAGPASLVNHMVCVCAYYTVIAVGNGTATLSNGIVTRYQSQPAIGDTVFLIRNSWGPAWAPANLIRPGCILVDQRFFETVQFAYLTKALVVS